MRPPRRGRGDPRGGLRRVRGGDRPPLRSERHLLDLAARPAPRAGDPVRDLERAQLAGVLVSRARPGAVRLDAEGGRRPDPHGGSEREGDVRRPRRAAGLAARGRLAAGNGGRRVPAPRRRARARPCRFAGRRGLPSVRHRPSHEPVDDRVAAAQDGGRGTARRRDRPDRVRLADWPTRGRPLGAPPRHQLRADDEQGRPHRLRCDRGRRPHVAVEGARSPEPGPLVRDRLAAHRPAPSLGRRLPGPGRAVRGARTDARPSEHDQHLRRAGAARSGRGRRARRRRRLSDGPGQVGRVGRGTAAAARGGAGGAAHPGPARRRLVLRGHRRPAPGRLHPPGRRIRGDVGGADRHGTPADRLVADRAGRSDPSRLCRGGAVELARPAGPEDGRRRDPPAAVLRRDAGLGPGGRVQRRVRRVHGEVREPLRRGRRVLGREPAHRRAAVRRPRLRDLAVRQPQRPRARRRGHARRATRRPTARRAARCGRWTAERARC